MITRFFGNTKPINYIVIFFFIGLFYFLVLFLGPNRVSTTSEILFGVTGYVFLLAQILVLDNLTKKTKISEVSSFPMLFFSVLVIAFSEVVTDTSILICNFFLLLASYQLLHLNPAKKINIRVFNAALWVCVASLFSPFAVFFIFPVYLAVYFYCGNELRNWLMPWAAIGSFLLITYAILILFGIEDFLRSHYNLVIKANFSEDYNYRDYTRLTLYALFMTLMLILVFSRLRNLGQGRITELRGFTNIFITAIVITFLSLGGKEGIRPILFSFSPTALFLTNYFEMFKKPRLKEFLLILVIILPLTVTILKLVS